jgi:hypothetical protein
VVTILLPAAPQAAETPGINIKPLKIHPLLKIKYGFDSNVFRTGSGYENTSYLTGLPIPGLPEDQVASGYLDLVSELGLELEILKLFFLNNFRAHFTDYQNPDADRQSTTRYPEFSGDHMLKWKSPAQGLSIEAEEKWKVTSDPLLLDHIYNWQGQRVKRFNNELGGVFTYTSKSGFWAEKLKYNWERNQFDESILRQMNYGVHSLTLQGENHLLPETALALALRYRSVLWDQKDISEEKNSDGLNLSVSFNGRVSEKLGSILGLGYEGVFYRSGDFEGTPIGLLKLIWKPRETMEFSFLGQREIKPSTVSQSYNNNIFQVSSRFRDLWPQGLEFGASFEWDWDQYESFWSGSIKTYHIHADTLYQFGGGLKWLKLGAEYNFDLVQCDSPYNPYNAHQVNFILEASY